MEKNINDLIGNLSKIDLSKIVDNMNMFKPLNIDVPSLEGLDLRNPVDETNELLSEHLIMVKEQNQLLRASLEQIIENYKILKEQYDLQVKINEENAEELKKSKNLNKWMLIVAILALASTIILGIL